jgi:hypothetical protein
MKIVVGLLFGMAASACAAAPAPAPPPPPAPEPSLEPLPHDRAWADRAGLPLRLDSGEEIPLPYLFTPLHVLGRDSAGVRVRCDVCGEGWVGVVSEADLVFDELPPEVAAWGSLAQFALSVRAAAERHDLDALRSVMAPDFSFSFIGTQSPGAAFAVWRAEQFATLDRVPGLLDQGIATRDDRFWVAPPAFVEVPTFRGLRTGFRQRLDGRWEWLYLIGGLVQD